MIANFVVQDIHILFLLWEERLIEKTEEECLFILILGISWLKLKKTADDLRQIYMNLYSLRIANSGRSGHGRI